MNKTLRKVLLAGLGAAVLTEQAARKVFNELVKKGKVSEKDAKAMIKNMVNKAKKDKDKVAKQVLGNAKKLVQNINEATLSEIGKLEKKLNKK